MIETPKAAVNPVSPLLRFMFWAVSVFPFISTAMLYAFAWYVHSAWGKWPVAYKDAVDLPIADAVMPLVMMSCELTLTALPIVWAGIFVVVTVTKLTKGILVPALFFISGMVLVWILGKMDPWNFQLWLFDCVGRK